MGIRPRGPTDGRRGSAQRTGNCRWSGAFGCGRRGPERRCVSGGGWLSRTAAGRRDGTRAQGTAGPVSVSSLVRWHMSSTCANFYCTVLEYKEKRTRRYLNLFVALRFDTLQVPHQISTIVGEPLSTCLIQKGFLKHRNRKRPEIIQ
jgi:hypothetical protein